MKAKKTVKAKKPAINEMASIQEAELEESLIQFDPVSGEAEEDLKPTSFGEAVIGAI